MRWKKGKKKTGRKEVCGAKRSLGPTPSKKGKSWKKKVNEREEKQKGVCTKRRLHVESKNGK